MSKHKDHYFDNDAVEATLCKYLETACTDIALRDEVMLKVEPVIRGFIRAKGLGRLFRNVRGADIEDELVSVAWTRVEQVLYKFTPGRAKLFSYVSQITYLVVLDYLKRTTKDACAITRWNEASSSGPPPQLLERREVPNIYVVLGELKESFRDNPQHVRMVQWLLDRYEQEDHPHVGVLTAMAAEFGRTAAVRFLERVRRAAGEG